MKIYVLSRNNVLSVKKIRPVVEQVVMKKLNKRKIRWIVRESERRARFLFNRKATKNNTKACKKSCKEIQR